jgi:CrcB protein
MVTLWVGLGGAIGSILRYWTGLLLLPVSSRLPWGTIGINILGSFVIGFFGTLTLAQGRYPLPETARLFVMVGICGGFTTFSSFSLQTLDLLRAGATGRAFMNIGLSVLLCLAAVAAGHAAALALKPGFDRTAQTALEEEVS